MSKRIEVMYTDSDNPRVVGERRWLCPGTGKVYREQSGTYHSGLGFKHARCGYWVSQNSVVREIGADKPDLAGAPVPVEPPTSPHPQAYKADDGKPNWFLLMSQEGCAKAVAGVVRVLSFAVRPVAQGGKGYAKHSWRQVPEAKERYEAALYRHLSKVSLGEELDDESGESHWYHIATNALFLAELHNEGKPQ